MSVQDPDYNEHGDPSTWVELTGEQTRCLIGLRNYYSKIEAKPPDVASTLAWQDLKNERDHNTGQLLFPELANATWYK